MIFGRPAGLRGFRPRSETSYMRTFAVALGVATGLYIWSEPLQEASGDVALEKGAGGCPQKAAGVEASGGGKGGGASSKQ